MATTQTLDSSIFASSHSDIVKRNSISNILFSIVLLLAGVFAFVATLELHDRSSAFGMALLVLGTGFVLLGIYRLVWKSKELVYVPTGSLARERSLFFDLKDMNVLADCIESGTFYKAFDMKKHSSGNVRMDVILSDDGRYAAVQLFQFVPYMYQPVTSVHYFTGEKAIAVAGFLNG